MASQFLVNERNVSRGIVNTNIMKSLISKQFSIPAYHSNSEHSQKYLIPNRFTDFHLPWKVLKRVQPHNEFSSGFGKGRFACGTLKILCTHWGGRTVRHGVFSSFGPRGGRRGEAGQIRSHSVRQVQRSGNGNSVESPRANAKSESYTYARSSVVRGIGVDNSTTRIV